MIIMVTMMKKPQDSQETQLTCRAGNTNFTAQVINDKNTTMIMMIVMMIMMNASQPQEPGA